MHERRRKNSRQLERHLKGVANHWRIDILYTVSKNPEITLEEIADRLEGNVKTISEHLRRMVHAGLVEKKYKGRAVAHTLSPYGKTFYHFLTTFQHS